MLNVNDLRHRIRILDRVITRDDEGSPIEDWTTKVTLWAEVNPLSGREYYQAAAVQSENDVKIRIRYRADISTDMRVQFNQKLYDIQSVVDWNSEHRELHLTVKEVVNG
ncbi:phage head closure protein [Thermoactinomyces sp. DSM 45892]|uniref:phage head closure protein n=1 Tax=Thermoactinomyces sp. DSM 45892 TaxID=1882753 RepID=UPI000895E3BF|nr:phage head closure protein [Thermoactinomyces sp. DSM 45892]SDY84663.1 phage head-tail adaptor, putative, SPP1 family [Thermoactinomyces sp. DSM 45892]